jgi:hypothetical protein
MRSRSLPIYGRSCRGCSLGYLHSPAGSPAVPLLGCSGRWPGGRVTLGVRRLVRSVAERGWSALVRRGWLWRTFDTAGDRGGARCQTSGHGSATEPMGDLGAWKECGGGGGTSGQLASQTLWQGLGFRTVCASDWVVFKVLSVRQGSFIHPGAAGEGDADLRCTMRI